MAESPTEIAAGGLTLVVAAGFFIYATGATGAWQGGGDTYPLVASFQSAQGVGPGTDVRLAGVRIGTFLISSMKSMRLLKKVNR